MDDEYSVLSGSTVKVSNLTACLLTGLMNKNNNKPKNLLQALRMLDKQAQRIQILEEENYRLRQVPSSLDFDETETVSPLPSNGTDVLATVTTVGFTTDVLPTDTTIGSNADGWSTGTNIGAPSCQELSFVDGETAVFSPASDGTEVLATGIAVGFTADVLHTDTTVGSNTDVWSTGTIIGAPACQEVSVVDGETAVFSPASDGTDVDVLATGITVGFTTHVLPNDTNVGAATDVWCAGANVGAAASDGEEVLLTVLNRAAAAVATEDTLRGIEGTNISSTASITTVTTVVSTEVPAAE